jgi:hypothetical protein
MSLPKPQLIVAGVDFGGMGGDPFVAELGVRFDDLSWRNLAEYWSKRTTWFDILQVFRIWKDKYHVERFWCDASQGNSIMALAAAGIPAIGTEIRDVQFRHRTLYSLAKARRWRYHAENCPQLHSEFQLFGYTRSRAGQVRMQERNDHCLDCVGYYLASEGETPELTKEELPPEERQPYYRDPDTGLMRFDPAAVIAHAKKPDIETEFEPTFDEMISSEDDDFEETQRQTWYYLTGTRFPESKK